MTSQDSLVGLTGFGGEARVHSCGSATYFPPSGDPGGEVSRSDFLHRFGEFESNVDLL